MINNDPLPSWNEGAVKSAILDFVRQVITTGSPDYRHPAERIATFDNDGTLWCEQPIQVQAYFLLDSDQSDRRRKPQTSSTATL